MTWDGVRYEIVEASRENAPAFDSVRRSKIAAAEAVSGIPLIIYATDFTDESRASQYGSGQEHCDECGGETTAPR